MIEVFNNGLDDGDWWVFRCKESGDILYEGSAPPSFKVWQDLLNTRGINLSLTELTNKKLKELMNETDN